MKKFKKKYKKLLNELLDIVDKHGLQQELINKISPDLEFHGGTALKMAANPAEYIPIVDRFLTERLEPKPVAPMLSSREIENFRSWCAEMHAKEEEIARRLK